MYHTVGDRELDPWGLCVTEKNFIEHLEVLKRYNFQCMSCAQLAQGYSDFDSSHPFVVFTFDDGYASSLRTILPSLERFEVPATFFITTGYVGQGKNYWWDELATLLLRCEKLPSSLELQLETGEHHWELNRAVHYSQEELSLDRDRRPWEAVLDSRLAFFYSVWGVLRPLPEKDRQICLQTIRTWANVPDERNPNYEILDVRGLQALASSQLVEIGAHSVTHPLFPSIPHSSQEVEIRQSKEYLEKNLNRSVFSFAYPYGECTRESSQSVESEGFTSACTSSEGRIQEPVPWFTLPRLCISDSNGEQFFQKLLHWIG